MFVSGGFLYAHTDPINIVAGDCLAGRNIGMDHKKPWEGEYCEHKDNAGF